MPNGKTHLKIELGIYPWILWLFHVVDKSWLDLFIFGLAYLIGSFFLSPDLDLHRNTCKRRWGKYGAIWEPYSLFSSHRGLSHHPVWGSLIRIAYVALLPFIGIVILLALAGFPWYALFNFRIIFLLIIGVMTSNLIHILIDRYWPSTNKKYKYLKESI